MKHLLSIEGLVQSDMETILADTATVKKERGRHNRMPLAGQSWAMLFSKSSTRTRVSFEVGIRELGGHAIFLPANEIQLGRGEPIKDTARVLGRMVHGAVFRTFAQSDVEEFAHYAGIPTINALTDQEHPCQILADIFTFQEKRGSIQGKVVTFVGDGACNVANSWGFATKLGFELRIAAPKAFQPSAAMLKRFGVDNQIVLDRAKAGAEGPWVTYARMRTLRSPERSVVLVTHYQRLLDYVVPDHVHVLDGYGALPVIRHDQIGQFDIGDLPGADAAENGNHLLALYKITDVDVLA